MEWRGHYPAAVGSPIPEQKFGDSFSVFLSKASEVPSTRSGQDLSLVGFWPLRRSFSGIFTRLTHP